ncbi:MAG: hypothetical protein K2L32_08515 [Muribaculaceae bacterium]|nr:hypothetical protein [Muribaculaceae bacterium]
MDEIIFTTMITLLNREDYRHVWRVSIKIAPKFLDEWVEADAVENLLGVTAMRTR